MARRSSSSSPRDFERIDSDAAVTLTLPDGRDIEGTVTDITVETTDGDAHVTVRVDAGRPRGAER